MTRAALIDLLRRLLARYEYPDASGLWAEARDAVDPPCPKKGKTR